MAAGGVTVVAPCPPWPAAPLTDLDHELDEDVLICGDKRDPERAVADIIERIPGLRAVKHGALETARLVEGLTPLLISVNARNKVTAGIKLSGLDEPRW